MTGLRLLAASLIFFLGLDLAVAQSLSEGGAARVKKIVDGDTVLLEGVIEGSNEVRLVGIQAPKLPLGRPGFKKWPLADDAKDRLESLVLGKTIELKFGGRRMDRHGRLLAHLYSENGRWVQGEMISAGMARVYSFPDNRATVDRMLSLEKVARDQKRGIWNHSYYRVHGVDDLGDLIGTFQLVEGVVFDVATVRGMTYLNFSDDWRRDFTISVNKRATALFTKTGLDLSSLKGQKVRIRGWLKKRNGPMIEATHPEQLEILAQ